MNPRILWRTTRYQVLLYPNYSAIDFRHLDSGRSVMLNRQEVRHFVAYLIRRQDVHRGRLEPALTDAWGEYAHRASASPAPTLSARKRHDPQVGEVASIETLKP